MAEAESPADGKDHLSCVKCVLGCVTGGFQAPTTARSNSSLNLQTPSNIPFHPRHFYRFVPELPKRPPIV
jgi:hypothetical protein